MDFLFHSLCKDDRIIRAKNTIESKKNFIFEGCNLIQKAQLIVLLKKRQALVLVGDKSEAFILCENLQQFHTNVKYLPENDLIFDNLEIKSTTDDNMKIKALSSLAQKEDVIVVTTANTLAHKFEKPQSFQENCIFIRKNDTIDRDAIERQLIFFGYERVDITELSGQYSIRGSLIDIYPINYDNPIRIDLWGDEITNICFFDNISQRSDTNFDLKIIKILPTGNFRSDISLKKEAFLFDYFDEDMTIFLDEIDLIFSNLENFYKNFEQNIDLFSLEEIKYNLSRKSNIYLSLLATSSDIICEKAEISCKSISGFKSRLNDFFTAIKNYLSDNFCIVVLIDSQRKAQRIALDMQNNGINAYFTEDRNKNLQIGEVVLTAGFLSEGIEYSDLKFVIITENDIFGKRLKKKKSKKHNHQAIGSFFDLHVGDLVVHEDHGLGRYLGVKNLKSAGCYKDYLQIEYENEAFLYIPVSQLDRIQKYVSKENILGKMKLNKLGGKEWENTKNRAKKTVQEVAEKLIKLYANRMEKKGYAYGKDTIWQSEFEDSFAYEETQSQLDAIEAVKEDMQSDRVMDRLICGDVGFGKTEIAIRAAFKAVQDSRQVAYLVPTTILAMQHYKTFKDRLADYPVNIAMMCRFNTTKNRKEILKNLKNGTLDIIIGTHSLLSKNVIFKDLGLLIIDEEQRFGVSHKEKIKELKNNIDVLTLTATPIPRTLHMSMIGVRDISILNDPPSNRLPINTYASPYDDEIVVRAIKREVKRGGQVFFVYNRVNTIKDMLNKLKNLMPDVSFAYAHGQMDSRELESVMYEFENRHIDVLLSTTIIETGLDMPNVNTMIIADAQRMGLSSLYQLRGRIGRSNKSSYAYLLYPKDRIIKEEAKKRLKAIKEFSALGSGYRIAMKDLEIRGEGNIFGFEQSGHIGAIGYELYCKMLKMAIAKLKNEDVKDMEYSTSIEILVDAYLPSDYIEDEKTRIDLYKRIALIDDEKSKKDMEYELKQRFGKLPKAVNNLINIALLKAASNAVYITSIKQKDNAIYFEMYEKSRIDVAKIERAIIEYNLEIARKKEPENKRLFATNNCLIYRHRYYGILSFSSKNEPCFIHKLNYDEEIIEPFEIIQKVIDVIRQLVI